MKQPSIKIINVIEDKDLPDWAIGDLHYNITVNGKKCFFRYVKDDQCMLYLDGLNTSGIDPDNAVYERDQCKKLFGIDIDTLDSLIIKAMKDWELKQSLSKDTRETFGGLLDVL
jgi:hypothetical protein